MEDLTEEYKNNNQSDERYSKVKFIIGPIELAAADEFLIIYSINDSN